MVFRKKVKPRKQHPIDEEALEERKHFNKWFLAFTKSNIAYWERGPVFQGMLHEIAKKAFARGIAYERKKYEITEVGGNN